MEIAMEIQFSPPAEPPGGPLRGWNLEKKKGQGNY